MTYTESYLRLKSLLDEQLNADETFKKLSEKIADGKADLNDAAEYSAKYSEMVGNFAADNISGVKSVSERRELCEQLLKDSYERLNQQISGVQKAVDGLEGINIAPQRAAYPDARVKLVSGSLCDPTAEPSAIKRRAKNAVTNVTNSFHDDYVKENARFRSDAGLKCYIVRTSHGKCCDWCAALVGRYPYGEEPKDVYRRHDNCTCTVTFENGRGRQDVWTKKTWEEPPENPPEFKPTVLTPEQAREAEEKNLRVRGLTEGGGSDKIKSSGIVISMQFFANKNISKSGDRELKKSIASWKKRIEEHEAKIADPEKYCEEWNIIGEEKQTGLINHWKHEIKIFNKDISLAVEELKKRGDENE